MGYEEIEKMFYEFVKSQWNFTDRPIQIEKTDSSITMYCVADKFEMYDKKIQNMWYKRLYKWWVGLLLRANLLNDYEVLAVYQSKDNEAYHEQDKQKRDKIREWHNWFLSLTQ